MPHKEMKKADQRLKLGCFNLRVIDMRLDDDHGVGATKIASAGSNPGMALVLWELMVPLEAKNPSTWQWTRMGWRRWRGRRSAPLARV